MAAKTSKSKTKSKAKPKAKITKSKKIVKTKTLKAKPVDFKFYAPLSKKVQLGGDFNKWKTAKLKGAKSGVWKTSLKLKPGRYEYRFVVDGRWENDNQRQTELVGNGMGQTNNVLIVG